MASTVIARRPRNNGLSRGQADSEPCERLENAAGPRRRVGGWLEVDIGLTPHPLQS
jgi:hypothetical protein